MKSSLLFAAIFMAGALMAPNAHAIAIRLGNQDPIAMARGNAFAATADNASAIYYNPAGLTQIDGSEIRVAAYNLFYDVDYDGPLGKQSMDDRLYVLPQLFYSMSPGENSPWRLGIGVYSPFGLGTDWSERGLLRTLATWNNVNYVTLAPTLAYDFGNGFSVGFGLSINYVDAVFRRGFLLPNDKFVFEGDGFGLGVNAGLLWQPSPRHSIGLTFRSGTTISLEGKNELRSFVPDIAPSYNVGAESELDVPHQFIVGYSFRPNENWNFEINVEWTEWSVLDKLVLETPVGDIVDPLDWRSSVIVSVGVTRRINENWSASVGYWFGENSVPSSTFNPRVSDMDFHVVSAGLHWEGEVWNASAALQFGFGEREVEGSAASVAGISADGDYEFRARALHLGIGRKW